MARAWADIAEHLPAEISGVEVEGAVLTIWGVDWTLTILGPWEGTLDGRAIYSGDDDLPGQLRSLVDEALLGVGGADLEDTGFQLSDGVLLSHRTPQSRRGDSGCSTTSSTTCQGVRDEVG